MMDGSEADLTHSKAAILSKMVDCELQNYQRKIISKTEENTKCLKTIAEYRTKIEQLEKAIQTLNQQEEKAKNIIYLHRNSYLISESLISSKKHEIQIIQEKRVATKKDREKIIEKYLQLSKTHKAIYEKTPWIQKNREVEIKIEIDNIHLNILKAEYSSTEKKISLFNKINDQRLKVAILNLAKDFVRRNTLKKQISNISEDIFDYETRLETLKEKKIQVRQNIDLKVKTAVAEIRERVVHDQENMGNVKAAFPPVVEAPTLKESIYSRLGIDGPLTLKRPPPLKSVMPPPSTLSRISETKGKTPVFPWKEKAKISVKETNKPSTLIHKSAGVHLPKSVKEILPVAAKESPPISSENPKTIVRSKKDEVQELGVEPSDCNPEKKKKILKRKTENNSFDRPILKKKVTFLEAKSNITSSEDRPDSTSVNKEVPFEYSTAVDTSADKKHDKEQRDAVAISKVTLSEVDKSKTDTVIEESGNLADVSTDTDSVFSLNFCSDNRDELNEITSIESPDFFLQRPQGYCFSPPLGKTANTDDSNDGKQSIYDFIGNMSPVNSKEKSNTSGQTSSFMDFFASSSPKKNATSSKSFFQLFG